MTELNDEVRKALEQQTAKQLDAIAQKQKEKQAALEDLAEEMKPNSEVPWRSPEMVFDPKTRLVTDKDYFNVVTETLTALEHPLAQLWDKSLDKEGSQLRSARDYPPEGQIFFINRYWRNFFTDNVKSYDTMLQRRALIDTYATFADWENLFKIAVAPYIPTEFDEKHYAKEQKSSSGDLPENAQ